MKRFGVGIAVLCVLMMVSAAQAENRLSARGRIENPVTVQSPRAPGDPVSLVLDDGSEDNSIGIGGTAQFLWANRFTPVELPIEITHILVYFGSTGGVSPGELFNVYGWSDANGDENVADAVYVGGQVDNPIGATLDDWTDITLTTPLQFAALTGDVWIGAVYLPIPGVGVWPASFDQTTTQARSWAGWYTTPNAPIPPTMPPDDTWGLIDGFGFPGNWMLQATGTVVPVELQRFSIE